MWRTWEPLTSRASPGANPRTSSGERRPADAGLDAERSPEVSVRPASSELRSFGAHGKGRSSASSGTATWWSRGPFRGRSPDPLIGALEAAGAPGTGQGSCAATAGWAPTWPAIFIGDVFARDDHGDLVDLPAVIGPIVQLLGWNIYVHGAVAIVTPPGGCVEEDEAGPSTSYGWHRDGGRMNRGQQGGLRPPPRLAVKAGFFLSDVSEPDEGNLRVIPGSHAGGLAVGQATRLGRGRLRPRGSNPLDRRLWHTASNHSDVTRVAVMIGFAHRWIRPLQNLTFQRRWRASSRQAASLGRGRQLRPVLPGAADVPLRRWAADGGSHTVLIAGRQRPAHEPHQ